VSSASSIVSPGAIPSPNVWNHAATYEIENHAVDPDGVIESTMAAIRPWLGSTVLDLGCGTGFHLPRFAADAARVIGVEPHGALVSAARRRIRGLANATVLQDTAQRLPLEDASVDVVHARWAYFFGPGCEPGLRELSRVVRRGGAAFVIDNDATGSSFGRWFRAAYPAHDAREVDAFFSRHGWANQRRTIRWSFGSRADFEAVVRIEFAPEIANRIIAEHQGCDVDYAVMIRVKQY
jgi:SAM-dependent methyltransferase